MNYLADVAALARKDLRLELRARDTLPAMLLFVLSTLVVFHFALPGGASDDAAYGLLWVALVFTALLGLARSWVPEGETGALDGLVGLVGAADLVPDHGVGDDALRLEDRTRRVDDR